MNAFSSLPPDGLVLCLRRCGALSGIHIGKVSDTLLLFSLVQHLALQFKAALGHDFELPHITFVLLVPQAGVKTDHHPITGVPVILLYVIDYWCVSAV